MLSLLVQRALPEYVPGALRRARSPHFVDPDLQTAGELAARRSLDELKARYAEEKLGLEEDLREAETRAEPVRYGLLYGIAAELVRAVAAVLAAAGLSTVDLDEELGATKSADLLITVGGSPQRLVELEAVSGAAEEHLVGHLQRHLDTWPSCGPTSRLLAVVVVNHQHKLHPCERQGCIPDRSSSLRRP